MPTIKIAVSTTLKTRPIQSSSLPADEKFVVKAGDLFEYRAIAKESGHIKFTLKEGAIAGRNTWYVFEKDVESFDNGIAPQDIRPEFNSIALAVVTHFEGFEERQYYCSANVSTIGYGSTRFFDGGDIPIGATISQEQAIELFKRDSKQFTAALRSLLKVPLSGKQIAALESFIYNVGEGGFAESTLLKKINANESEVEICAQFMRWTNDGLAGLVRRRSAECDLWVGKMPPL
jgi:lysozyme